jgi:hypothetical protein
VASTPDVFVSHDDAVHAIADAVHAIADAVLDRTSFVCTMPPGEMGRLGAALAGLPSGWTAYIDNGLPDILWADRRALVEAAGILGWLGLAIGVLLVPKVIPARKSARRSGCPPSLTTAAATS